MLKQEQLNFSRQIIKQDNEISQVMKYLDLQKEVLLKNQEKTQKMENQQRQLQWQREEDRKERQMKQQMKSLELTMIKEQYEENQQQKQNNLSKRLEHQQLKHEQLLNESRTMKQQKSIMRQIYLQDQVQNAREYSTQQSQMRKQLFENKWNKKEQQLQQLQADKQIKRHESSIMFQVKQLMNNEAFDKHIEKVKEKQQTYQKNIEVKDSLSTQVLIENQRKLNHRLLLQKTRLEVGLDGVRVASEQFNDRLNHKQILCEQKMDKLDQMIKEKELIQMRERERRALIQQQKYQMQQQFLKQVSLLDKQQKQLG